MAQKSNSFERFWKELKRRKVVHVITVYAAIAFVILQLVDMVAEPLRLPDSTKALAIVLLCIGFIIAVFVSWVYDITPAGVKKTKPASAVKHIDQTTTPIPSGWKIATYVSGAIIIALVAFNFISRRNLNADISKLQKSIAVLPFINDSPDSTNSYFINGLMDKITTNLQMVKELRVISRTSVEQYRNRTKSIPEIAKEQDVNYIVEGNGQKYGSSFSVDVKLIKAKGKETHLWAKSYENEIKETRDIIRVQSQIAQAIASELKAVITPEEKKRIEKTPTANLTAYDFYQRGREEHLKYQPNSNNIEPVKKAEIFFKTALKYDSTYAQAYTGLAKVYWDKHYWKEYFSKNFMDSVLFLVNIALSFDDKLAEAYDIKGLYYATKGSANEALQEYNKALEFNPNDWVAYSGKAGLYADLDLLQFIENIQKAASLNRGSELASLIRSIAYGYESAGFMDKAQFYNLEALKLDNDSVQFLENLAFCSFDSGNSEKAIEILKKDYVKDTNYINTVNYLGYGYMFLGQHKESLKYYLKYSAILETHGQISTNNMHRIGYAYFKNGYKKEAEFYFKKQIEYCENIIKLGRRSVAAQEPFYTYYDLAGVYAFRGDKNKAYKNLNNFNQIQRIPLWMVTLIKNDPLFDNIRNEPEFQQIVKDVETKYQAEHERVKKWLEEQGML